MSKAMVQEIVWLDIALIEPAPWNINEINDETFTALLDDMKQRDGPNRVNPPASDPSATADTSSSTATNASTPPSASAGRRFVA